MLRTIVALLAIGLASGGWLQAARQEPSNPSPASQQRALLNRYCVTCHNERLKTAGLLLDKMDVEQVSAAAEVWEKVVRKLRTEAMPPAGVPRPDKAGYDSFATYLETALDRAAAAKPNPGRPAGVHRLNRAEYSNAIRDLLALEIDANALLPADEESHGFDNNGDVLSVSPSLLERYVIASRKISLLALGDPAISPGVAKYDVPTRLIQEDRMSEDLPFGSRGGMAIRHHFPMDGEYVIKISLLRNATGSILGLAEPHDLDVRLDGSRIKRFTVGGAFKLDLSGPTPEEVYRPNPERAKREEYEQTSDKALEIRFPAKAGTRLVGVAFVNDGSAPEDILRSRLPAFAFNNYREGSPAVASVSIGGPYNATGAGDTPSRRKVLVCRPTGAPGSARGNDEATCARTILSTLARRAYRRPPTDEDIQTLLSFYQVGSQKGGFEAGIGMALRGILVSPDFVFRIERDPANLAPGAAYPITDLELASRLSFFLWSSIPDDTLLDLAERGKLKDPAVLEQQVRRMLADSRSKALVDNFAGQWLYLRNVGAKSPEPAAFPEFDDSLREAFQQETELFFESMLREDRSVVNLLNADYTFLNGRLARHYGIPNIYGSHFRRVTLSDDLRRGLLGQGSILMVTSYATRTSPVTRGKWLLEQVLGAPPPPPPANVPALKDAGADGKPQSVRQRMEQHRANPVCAGCHARMDPLGFSLENFDGIGRWRTMESNAPIDPSGVLPDGTKFQGPAGLRKILLDHPERFVTTVTEKLLTYALGRGVEYYDQPAIRTILREAARSEYRWSSLILGIVKSTPFQMRASAEQTPERTAAAGLR